MNHLSNSGLLDGDVAKNMNPMYTNPNRVERLQKTTQFAENPQQEMEEPVHEETHNFNHNEPKLEAEDEKPSSAQIDKYSTPYAEPKKAVEVDNDKIFGMNKWLVIGVATTVVAIGGYFLYTKYFKKAGVAAAEIIPAANPAVVLPK